MSTTEINILPTRKPTEGLQSNVNELYLVISVGKHADRISVSAKW